MKDKIEIKLAVNGDNLIYKIDIPKNLENLPDLMLEKFDIILRDYVCKNKLGKKWDETTEAEKVVIDSLIESLSKYVETESEFEGI